MQKKHWILVIINILLVLFSAIAFVFVGSMGLLFRTALGVTIVIFCASAFFLNRSYPVKMKRAKAAKIKAIEAMFFLFLGVSLMIFIQTFDVNFDWTQKKLYHLSKETKTILYELPIDINIIIFAYNDKNNAKTIQYAKIMAEKYRATNPKKITIKYVDPIKDKILADKYGLKQNGTIVFETETNREYLMMDSLYEIIPGKEILIFKGETIFSAIVNKLVQKKETVIYYLLGHGETNFSSGGISGYDRVKQIFEDRRYVFKPLNLENHFSVPEDANLLVISDPKTRFSSQVIDHIENYINETGSVMYLLGSQTTEDINFLLLKSGFAFVQNIVTDPSRTSSAQGEFSIIPLLSPKSEITRSLRKNISVLFPTASVIEIVPEEFSKKDELYDIQILAKISKHGFAQRVKNNKTAEILPKELNTVALSSIVAPKTDPEKQRRTIVIGSTSFIDNSRIVLGGNSQLFLNSVDFLLDKDLAYTVSPKEENLSLSVPSPEKSRAILLLVLIWNLVFFVFSLYKLIRRMRKVKIS